jgi:hypothetical protein
MNKESEFLAQPEQETKYLALRNHFAGLAMQVLLVDATSMDNVASNSYHMADAMLKAREDSNTFDKKVCSVCKTTENIEWVGGFQEYRCDSSECIPY